MGCNYYVIPRLTAELKDKMLHALQNDDIAHLSNLIPKELHIGKSSAGYPFVFDHNNWLYYKSPEELFDFIKGCEIYDDDQEEMEYEDFMRIIEYKQKYLTEFYFEKSHYFIQDGYMFSTMTQFS